MLCDEIYLEFDNLFIYYELLSKFDCLNPLSLDYYRFFFL